jgi:hypothetical protein
MNFHSIDGVCNFTSHDHRPTPFARPTNRLFTVAVSVVLLVFSGCSGEAESPKVPDDQQNILFILRAYCKVNGDQHRPPTSIEELKPALKEFGDVEKIIRSPRDGEIYVIVGGIDLSRMPSGGVLPVVAYERKGVSGKRQVVDLRGSVRELTPEEFRQLKFPPSHKPPSN